jgi:hypothetical protein
MNRTVPELLATTTSMELAYWAGFHVHEPFGNEWAAFAGLAKYLAQIAGYSEAGCEAVQKGFPPVRYEPPVEEQIAEAEAKLEPVQSQEEIREQLAKLGIWNPVKEQPDV